MDDLDDCVCEDCEDCGSVEATYRPCPFAFDLFGNDTKHWLCTDCANERAADV